MEAGTMKTQKHKPTTKIVSTASGPMTVKTVLTLPRTSAQNLIVDQKIRNPSAPWTGLKVVVVVADAAVKTGQTQTKSKQQSKPKRISRFLESARPN